MDRLRILFTLILFGSASLASPANSDDKAGGGNVTHGDEQGVKSARSGSEREKERAIERFEQSLVKVKAEFQALWNLLNDEACHENGPNKASFKAAVKLQRDKLDKAADDAAYEYNRLLVSKQLDSTDKMKLENDFDSIKHLEVGLPNGQILWPYGRIIGAYDEPEEPFPFSSVSDVAEFKKGNRSSVKGVDMIP